MTTAYITESNFTKIARKNLNEITDDITDVCKRVYEARDISKFLSHREIKFLECKRLLLESTEECIERFVEKAKKEETKEIAIHTNSMYVFVGTTPPKYHSDRGCTFLTKDYLNFIIPVEIADRGSKDVAKFREFADANKQLLLDKKEYLFVQRLKSQFNLRHDISKISFSNTGIQSLDISDDRGVDVSREIDDVLNEIDAIGRTEAGALLLKKFRFMDHRARHQSQIDEGCRSLLALKARLAHLIVKFHLQNNAMNGFSFDEQLLNLIGFERCGACGKNAERVDMKFF